MAIVRFLYSSFLLAFKVESNWTRPFWFFFYHAIRPFSTVILVLFMYKAILGFDFENPYFPFLYTGTVFWTFIQNSIFGISWSILGDREFYQTLKYMVTLPFPYSLNLFGRFLAYLVLSIFSVTILLLAGKIIFKVNYLIGPLFFIYFFSAIPLFFSSGLLFSSLLLIYPRYAFFIQELFSGVLFLISGVIYPVKILPYPLNLIAAYSPVTIWLDGLRKSLGLKLFSQEIFNPENVSFIFIFFLFSFFFSIISIYLFNLSENMARKKGLLEETTGG
ncbi:MAG: ABC transporter permease [candidate division WOR-3 bacterium]